ncbi:NUDIX domain-containing protein [Allonocardiopsis opalescens]|uniref:8-oxo-dGTP diphosphatase n=1 Tax=Allonocardiopsis opalescens TaxID=1144618 RepID=A0A2T0Q228_9ACTN|nr:NUDIX domain-containing protein [Allonocardiopsis opalescens]PRX97847.1 8-oxo-dGTP diphosphatase [Allonocardiopsis opalescens]
MNDDPDRLLADAVREGVETFAVGAVVHDGDRVLLLRRRADDSSYPGFEEFPSGGVEPGETLPAALARELAEEVGWHRPLVRDAGFATWFDYLSRRGRRRSRQFTFSVGYDGEPIVLSDEHTGYRWLPFGELAAARLTPEVRGSVQRWAEAIGPLSGRGGGPASARR